MLSNLNLAAMALTLLVGTAMPVHGYELVPVPNDAHEGSAAVYRASGGDVCPTATTWLDPVLNDLWIDCGPDRGVYVWEAHTGELYAYQGWGDALANRPDID